eukprot:4114890-Prymnesium_polylepis.1
MASNTKAATACASVSSGYAGSWPGAKPCGGIHCSRCISCCARLDLLASVREDFSPSQAQKTEGGRHQSRTASACVTASQDAAPERLATPRCATREHDMWMKPPIRISVIGVAVGRRRS